MTLRGRLSLLTTGPAWNLKVLTGRLAVQSCDFYSVFRFSSRRAEATHFAGIAGSETCRRGTPLAFPAADPSASITRCACLLSLQLSPGADRGGEFSGLLLSGIDRQPWGQAWPRVPRGSQVGIAEHLHPLCCLREERAE